MATASRESRPRPPIQPIRTTGPGHSSQAVHARMAFKSPAWLATPYSPLSRPPPVHPDSDNRMREHDKAAVERLEPRSRRSSSSPEGDPRIIHLRPIPERVPTTPLGLSAQRPPLSAPLLPFPVYHRPTIAEETRSMLMPDSEPDQIVPLSHAMSRRGSAPGGANRARNLHLQRQREYYRRRGFIGHYQPCEPDLLVVPVELKRLSMIAPHNGDSDTPYPYPVEDRLTTRVVIHSHNRKPLVLTRTFDLNELRATIPDTVETPVAACGGRASMATLQVPTPVTGTRPRSPLSPAMPRERRHSSIELPRFDQSRSPRLENKAARHRYAAVPIHLEYARKYLPVLAAIILSEIVQPGDTLELPIPHPRSWQDTVAYIYTGRVELTEPIRQNITYLGGRV